MQRHPLHIGSIIKQLGLVGIMLLSSCVARATPPQASSSAIVPILLPPDQAFTLDSELSADGLILHFHVAPDFYLYEQNFRFEAKTPGLTVRPHFARAADWKDDPFRGHIKVYTHDVDVELHATGNGNVLVAWQGASNRGLGYPEQTRLLIIDDGKPADVTAQAGGAIIADTMPIPPPEQTVVVNPLPSPSAPAETSAVASPVVINNTPGSFTPVKTVSDVQAVIVQAAKDHKIVMLNLYSEWCEPCKTMQKTVFTDPRVAKRISHFVLIQADMGANSSEDQNLQGYFGILDLPDVLFFRDGNELATLRVEEGLTVDKFLERLDEVSPESPKAKKK